MDLYEKQRRLSFGQQTAAERRPSRKAPVPEREGEEATGAPGVGRKILVPTEAAVPQEEKTIWKPDAPEEPPREADAAISEEKGFTEERTQAEMHAHAEASDAGASGEEEEEEETWTPDDDDEDDDDEDDEDDDEIPREQSVKL
eukprot:scaffold7673_cov258-Pinguiococcus_pyrenoidosus.AAC.10